MEISRDLFWFMFISPKRITDVNDEVVRLWVQKKWYMPFNEIDRAVTFWKYMGCTGEPVTFTQWREYDDMSWNWHGSTSVSVGSKKLRYPGLLAHCIDNRPKKFVGFEIEWSDA